MITKLSHVLKRELSIKGRSYVLTIDDDGMKLTLKGKRNGQQLLWEDWVSGDAALATALNASLKKANDEEVAKPPRRKNAKGKRLKLVR